MEFLNWSFLVLSLVVLFYLLRRFGFIDYLFQKLINILMNKLEQKVGLKGLDSLFTNLVMRNDCEFHDTYAVISYPHQGKDWKLYLPYTRRTPPRYLEVRVFLQKAGQLTEITQQPGLPYLINAERLGGTALILRGNDREITLETTTIPTLEHFQRLFNDDEIGAAAH